MAQVIVDVPDAIFPAVRDAFGKYHGWPAAANAGETLNQFCKRMLAKYVKDCYKSQVRIDAANTAAAEADTTTNSADIT
jgi:hypothetical protein